MIYRSGSVIVTVIPSENCCTANTITMFNAPTVCSSIADRKMPCFRNHFSTMTVFVLVAATCYVTSYVVLVQRQPVFYGNRLVQIRLVTNEDGTLSCGEPISPPADAYRVDYRCKISWIRTLFRPAHWIDRTIRPNYWPAPEPRRISC